MDGHHDHDTHLDHFGDHGGRHGGHGRHHRRNWRWRFGIALGRALLFGRPYYSSSYYSTYSYSPYWYGDDFGYGAYDPAYSAAPVAEPLYDVPVVSSYLEDALAAFRSRDYAQAARLAEHAALERPEDGLLHLFLSQAQFAVGDFGRATESLSVALSLLPREQWGSLVGNYRDYYGSIGDYTRQLRELEAFARAEPTVPLGHLLLGYHYGYLGYPREALRELEQAVELSQQDELARDLYNVFAGVN